MSNRTANRQRVVEIDWTSGRSFSDGAGFIERANGQDGFEDPRLDNRTVLVTIVSSSTHA